MYNGGYFIRVLEKFCGGNFMSRDVGPMNKLNLKLWNNFTIHFILVFSKSLCTLLIYDYYVIVIK